jgi:predicted enzyme related to lactoylglutathione lyase
MLPLIIDETQDTPQVILDNQQNQYWFRGTSIPENTKKFYEPVFAWIAEYVKQPNKETILNFKMKYFNTSSTKSLLDIMDTFKELARQGHPLIINWYFHAEDEDMYEAGVGFSKMVRFPFNYIKY